MSGRNPPPQLMNMNSLLNFPKIPEEILFDEILARLPVKSLLKFKCVSKSWRSLIESDRFIEIQYRNSAKNPRVILSNLGDEGMSRCTLQWLLTELKEGSDPTKNIELKNCIPVGSFNGVVCFYDCRHKYRDCGRFRLWNPATRVSVELPHDNVGDSTILVKYGFGWDEKTGAHKVFVVMIDGKTFQETGIVYNSDTNSWRSISSGSLYMSRERGVFLRGNLHWIDRLHHEVECFDLEREEFGRLELPLLCSNDAFRPITRRSLLGVIGGSLSILFDLAKNFEVWVMKEYGVKDSWLKFLTFPSTSLSRPAYGNWPIFGECPNGEIFIIYRETVTIYSPKYDAYSTATTNVRYLDIHVYADSLVSPRR